MRLFIMAAVALLAICWSVPDVTNGGGNPDTTLHLTRRNLQRKVQRRKWEIHRMKQELKSRELLRRLGDRVNQMGSESLEQRYGIKTYSEYQSLSPEEIHTRIAFEGESLLYEVEGLSRIAPTPLPPPRRADGPIITIPEPGRSEAVPNTYIDADLKNILLNPEFVDDPSHPDYAVNHNSFIMQSSKSVVAIIHKDHLTEQDDGTFELRTEPLLLIGGNSLCEFSEFHSAISTKVAGTGFLVADNLIATAGHVYDNMDDIINDFYYVFDYKMLDTETVKTTYTDEEVYRAQGLVRRMNRHGNDWALIRLQRPVAGRPPLTYRDEDDEKIPDYTIQLFMLGHPFGMPMQFSGGNEAVIVDNSACHYFTCFLNNYQYNSGSPVFSLETRRVEGILCRDIGPGVSEYCDCACPALVDAKYGAPGVEVTRSIMFASYLQRPDSIRICCDVDAAFVQFEGGSRLSDTLFTFTEGDTQTIVYSDIYDMELLIDNAAQCWMPFTPGRGDLWNIKYGLRGGIAIQKVCGTTPEPDPEGPE